IFIFIDILSLHVYINFVLRTRVQGKVNKDFFYAARWDRMASPNNYTGKIIGSYRVLEELGSGAYGGVYRGEHIFITGRVVAIKVLPVVHLDSQQELGNFIQEARFL